MLPPEFNRAIDDLMKADLQYARDMWFGLLLAATWMVGVGLALEGPELWFEIRDIFRRRRDRRNFFVTWPAETPDWRKLWAFAGWVLIVLGVMAEGYIEAKVNDADRDLQTFNDHLLADAIKQAGDAETSAKGAALAEREVEKQADALKLRIDAASRQLGRLDEHIRVQGPRWKLLEDNKTAFIAALKPFVGQRITVVTCGQWASVETEPFKLGTL
jgi:hypothetical protein